MPYIRSGNYGVGGGDIGGDDPRGGGGISFSFPLPPAGPGPHTGSRSGPIFSGSSHSGTQGPSVSSPPPSVSSSSSSKSSGLHFPRLSQAHPFEFGVEYQPF